MLNMPKVNKISCYFLVVLTTINLAIQAQIKEHDSVAITINLHQPQPIFSVPNLAFPILSIAYGFGASHSSNLTKYNKNFQQSIATTNKGTHIDNYLQYSPLLAIAALHTFGVASINKPKAQVKLALLTTIISTAIVVPLKKITRELRPDGSCNTSFPSGHTTTAFAGAELLHQEYKNATPIISILGYAAAATTGILRVYNNKHWLSDVIAGAGFGIISTKATYWLYPKLAKAFTQQHKTLLATIY